MGFHGHSDSKASACNVGDLGLIPGSRQSPGRGSGYLLQYSCLENSMGKRAFIFLGAKITADSDCSHLLLGRKAMTNLDTVLKSRHYFTNKGLSCQSFVFPVVMYECDSWTIKKAECSRIDAFELWCWRRLLKVSWTARRSNQSILKEISPEYSLEGLMLKLKLQHFGHFEELTHWKRP